jgi:hypothetical protein
MEYSHILALFPRVWAFFEATIWIRIRIKVMRIHNTDQKSGISNLKYVLGG